jgi:hypothetical protein
MSLFEINPDKYNRDVFCAFEYPVDLENNKEVRR